MWAIVFVIIKKCGRLTHFFVTFVLKLVFIVLFGSLHEELEEDHAIWTQVNSTLTSKLVQPTLIFHPH